MTNNKPLVSIVCTSYNHEKYIKNTLNGFVSQKTNFPIEIIVHDDASTDSSAAIIKDYENKYPHLFKNIYQSSNQYSKGRNIWEYIFSNHCSGKYIALCEGDDYWIDSFKLQKQINFLENNSEYVLCSHNAKIIYNNVMSDVLFNEHTTDYDISMSEIIMGWSIPTASIVFRKSAIKYPEWHARIINGDILLTTLLRDKGKIFFMNDTMSVYRKHLGGLSFQINKIPFEYLQRLKELYVDLDQYFDYRYTDIIEKKIKKINISIYKQKLIHSIPIIYWLRSLYRSFKYIKKI